MSQWHAHSRSVVFHTLHRCQRDTILCPLTSCFRSVVLSLPLSLSGILSLYPPHHSFPPSSSITGDAASCVPSGSIPSCHHHRIPTCSPGALYDPSHRSNSDCVAMYCATVFWSRLIYPASSCDVAAEVYVHLQSSVILERHPVSHIATWY